jgi:hypothetical protein
MDVASVMRSIVAWPSRATARTEPSAGYQVTPAVPSGVGTRSMVGPTADFACAFLLIVRSFPTGEEVGDGSGHRVVARDDVAARVF